MQRVKPAKLIFLRFWVPIISSSGPMFKNHQKFMIKIKTLGQISAPVQAIQALNCKIIKSLLQLQIKNKLFTPMKQK